MNPAPGDSPFALVAAAYLERVVDRYASNLEELRLGIEQAAPEVLFLHTQLPRLAREPRAGTPIDDFSHWVGAVVMDAETAERMAFAVQSCAPGMSGLRAALLDPLARVSDSRRRERGAPAGGGFVFRAAECVALPTGIEVTEPGQLLEAMAHADPSVWFHHLVEEQWLPTAAPQLMHWLDRPGLGWIRDLLQAEAASGRPIRAVRERVVRRWRRREIGRRVIAAADRPGGDRRMAERAAASGLVHRWKGGRSSG